MILNYLLKPWITKNVPNINILNLTLNSKNIKNNSLFFSINGYLEKGSKYIQESINNGSIAIIIETENIYEHGKIINNKIPIIFFYKLKIFISEISGRFYNNPSNKLNLIGITGTNGKTTVSYISSQLINLINKYNKSAIIGTLGNGIIPNLIETKNTTDSPIDLQETLYKFYKNNIDTVFLEVSSHSILQNRIKNLKFKYTVFTNISHEHLDFHKNMFSYKKSKYKLFNEYKVINSIINVDNKFGKKISNKIKCTSVSLFKKIYIKCRSIYVNIKKIKFIKYKSYLEIIINNIKYNILLNFIGYFNVNNFIISLVTLIELGYKVNDIIKVSSLINLPPGRMEIIKFNKIDIIIDYAHTPDAIINILLTIRKICIGKIWCIFGCGGNKDKLKRPIMGKLAYKYSDYVILTSDNTKNENINDIINDIIKYINYKNNINIIIDREKAIKFSICNSNKYDIILILGKGHEKFQIIGNDLFNFSDKEIVLKLINKL
ncbi:UDP-N-acetylmuramoyl-L-alanyl-D-glutamate--2,6-diaminopimelate ligase [endosymbiont of Pachyrhynchus infernalis]|uniref:UDP-N-acetylmuramoyl-L-alanyl-D-glutamate--2, 6-diaminopimelate ligase n=1 Tax=endosymbiont of Pachyrhynchus infernalis TaxID=1971488 RepID=UPI000DC6D29E|nr:UDP-N-acetylmuramoyl-L-alanyl-D-glutamate--2,6-diaminopimelate ligase [endosymbiont of Pachyrhynchus infernalis]BBA84762.1 UDP-N-acetylmuramoyl-L-alanyl-D-glutamate--2 6-diaminopimelate ligase [endosymbiont of Pachyrhynchus infernalis]